MMKLAFSTDYWKNLSWAEYVSLAKEMQFSGIEIHDIEESVFKAENAIFSDAVFAEARRLANLGISIPCLDTVFNMANADLADENLETLKSYLTAAKNVRAPFVRLYAKELNGEPLDTIDDAVIAFLHKALPLAEKAGVVLLIETAGVYADTSRLEAEVGYKPSISLHEGIKCFIDWYKSDKNPLKD